MLLVVAVTDHDDAWSLYLAEAVEVAPAEGEVVVAEAENVPATGFAAPAPEESNGAPPKQKRSKRAKRSKRN